MSLEKTLSIIKPDAVSKGLAEEICSRIEKSGLVIKTKRSLHLSKSEAENFYSDHKSKPFFPSLIEFMTSGPVQIQVLSGDSAIEVNRSIMGATNPDEADDNTIRKEFATSVQELSLIHI